MTSKTDVEVKGKPERRKPIRPLGVPIDKLQVENKQAGMHYVWIKQSDIPTYEDAGYEHVLRDDPERVASVDMTGTSGSLGSAVARVVDRNGRVDFLMRIPEAEWKAQQLQRDKESEATLKDISEGNNPYQFKGSYVPKR